MNLKDNNRYDDAQHYTFRNFVTFLFTTHYSMDKTKEQQLGKTRRNNGGNEKILQNLRRKQVVHVASDFNLPLISASKTFRSVTVILLSVSPLI